MVRLVGLIRRKSSLTHSEFRELYKHHVPVVEKLPNLRGYTQLVPANPEACKFDGIGELYFDTIEDCEKAFNSPAGDAQFDDAKRFAQLPTVDDPYQAARNNNLSMVFETQTDIDYNNS
jgi:uncharacterized protein (TIGR02118 family)